MGLQKSFKAFQGVQGFQGAFSGHKRSTREANRGLSWVSEGFQDISTCFIGFLESFRTVSERFRFWRSFQAFFKVFQLFQEAFKGFKRLHVDFSKFQGTSRKLIRNFRGSQGFKGRQGS